MIRNGLKRHPKMQTICATINGSTGLFLSCIWRKANVLKLAITAAMRQRITPSSSPEISFLLSLLLPERESKTMPTVLIAKTITSWIVIRSLMSMYAIIDVKNGFSKIRMTFDVDVSLRAINISRCAHVVPTTLAPTNGSYSRLMPSKKEVFIGSPFRIST